MAAESEQWQRLALVAAYAGNGGDQYHAAASR
eukprot:CAMPEP_0113727422 /NCGR_PEP_ID=MMETSP0038_2-20120614/41109_1 /TAXON_ID=2898 /ORGANISM="Cryptomonas paramecium" /LENGTH=31 /DNA_ID=CAMNT_0000658399 /DNA_START=99 /DNA_END=191 /DNA_ORIENTATION=+ /assembly_acc=CAM_ASM_000170